MVQVYCFETIAHQAHNRTSRYLGVHTYMPMHVDASSEVVCMSSVSSVLAVVVAHVSRWTKTRVIYNTTNGDETQ